MFGEAKGFFDGLAAVFDTADTTVATIVWNAVLEKKKTLPQHNEIDLTFDQQKIEAYSASDLNIIWHKISFGKYNTKNFAVFFSKSFLKIFHICRVFNIGNYIAYFQ